MSDRMSPLDACWLQMEGADHPMMVTAVLLLGAPLPFDALAELVERRLVARYPRFSQRAVGAPFGVGVGWWEADPHFDLRRHVRRAALPTPGGRPALQALVADLMSTQLDLRRSPWELHLVEGVDQGSAVVARVHHCVADGLSLARVLLSLADGGAPPAASARPARTAGALARGALRRPLRAARRLAEQTGSALRLLALPPDPPSPLRGALGARKVCAWSDPVPLEALKQLGHAESVTVNDVLLGALAGALRGWLLARGAEVGALRVFVPVNLRPPEEPIPAELGNTFSLVVVELPVGLADPRARRAFVHARMDTIKHGRDPEVVYAALAAMGAAPPAVERWGVDFLGQKGTAIVTNVPGPREPLTLGGAPLDGVLVWVPQAGNVALGVSLLSYAGSVTVGVATDERVVADPGSIVAGVVQELSAGR